VLLLVIGELVVVWVVEGLVVMLVFDVGSRMLSGVKLWCLGVDWVGVVLVMVWVDGYCWLFCVDL
ncbi:hypothetical protein GUF71_10765, partial [Xanthomonas citri pv. citri]|nr:hypothetical protein [Xanthomonas citri pv. citri]